MKFALAAVAALGLVCSAAMGDWPHPIKWDQMSGGIYNYGAHSTLDFDSGIFTTTADDFLCTETGWITDIHFAGFSEFGDSFINQFRITFWTDVPAIPDVDESHPGDLIYEYYVDPVVDGDPLGIGWQALGDDTYRINLPEDEWFWQDEGNIYWIGIQGVMVDDGFRDTFFWNFADPAAGIWGDDAAFEGEFFGFLPWANWGFVDDGTGVLVPDLYEGPFPGDPFVSSADMAFALTGIPGPPSLLALVGMLGLSLGRRRR